VTRETTGKRNHHGSLDSLFLRLLRTRMMLPLAVLFAVAVTMTIYLQGRSVVRQQDQMARDIATDVETYLRSAGNTLHSVALLTDSVDTDDLDSHMQVLQRTSGYYNAIQYIDAEGMLRAMAPPDRYRIGFDLSYQDFFDLDAVPTNMKVSRPFLSSVSGQPVAQVAWPAVSGGVVVGDLNLGTLQDMLTSAHNAIEDRTFFIASSTGTLLAHSDFELVDQQANVANLPVFKQANNGNVRPLSFSKGHWLLSSAAVVPRSGWLILLQSSVATAIVPYMRLTGVGSILYICLWLGVSVGFRNRIRRNVVHPLILLTERANALETGDFSDATAIPRPNEAFAEVRALEISFSEMRRGIQLRESALKQNELRYRGIVEDQTELICRTLPDRTLSFVNLAFCRYFQRTGRNLLGTAYDALIAKEDQGMIASRFAALSTAHPVDTVESRNLPPGQLVRWVQWTNRAIYDANDDLIEYQCVGRDVTERKDLELQLMQAKKMEAIGDLAGGIAHDFNNILGPIIGYSDMVLSDIPPGSRAARHVRQISKAGARAKDLVNQILTFSRRQATTPEPISMQGVLHEALDLLRSSIPSTIDFRLSITEAPYFVYADSTQIHQIIMNLCTNAYHAMRETGGILGVSLAQVEVALNDSPAAAGLRQGLYVELLVTDSGHGMSRQVLDRIYEPYFSTKAKGRGTGLGLSTVHGIVKGLQGEISVRSEVGTGSTVRVLLPAISGLDLGAAPRTTAAIPTGTERILAVDDDPDIASLVKTMLEDLGYTVSAYTSSVALLHDFEKHPDICDLVITDMTMPSATGAEIARRVLLARPELPVVLCTGFSDQMDENTARDLGIAAFLMKPIARKDLAECVRNALDRPSQR
jgi:PAS domain S-box-containing protein